eukprot:CAMPEP_0173390022 /NCGR_PEP_ID=MMETSP1356-20130122/14249_1 /TAXON_ID=77927 ORGANISM="Hemiselmis virescens, Strain PCC157" /NCGR_SAMPLE_ID=MMETSP1356 /ASSEMBLY_ACC=CAM_ASM_000847 /LENGTH=151 /DNA_ID=CAMNT_0014347329 /DNA_START=27 /DNA_END=482 /DNA_ORIENTATION=+
MPSSYTIVAGAIALLASTASAATSPAFATSSHLPLSLGSRQAACTQVQMGLLSTNDLPPYAPKVLNSRRIARLLNKNCIVEAQLKLTTEAEAGLKQGELAAKSGEIYVAKQGLERALVALEQLGTPPSSKIGLTSLPGRAWELQNKIRTLK